LGVLLSLVSVPLLIRHLGFSDYGRYVTVISLVTIVKGVTDVELGQMGVREYSIRSGSDRSRLLRNLLGVRFALTGIGVAGTYAREGSGVLRASQRLGQER
jgi:O-antigen/teichoic acid export membrane protein